MDDPLCNMSALVWGAPVTIAPAAPSFSLYMQMYLFQPTSEILEILWPIPIFYECFNLYKKFQ